MGALWHNETTMAAKKTYLRLGSIDGGETLDAFFVPSGRSEFSPAIHRRVSRYLIFVPSGRLNSRLIQPSLQDGKTTRRIPGDESPG